MRAILAAIPVAITYKTRLQSIDKGREVNRKKSKTEIFLADNGEYLFDF